MKREVWIWRNLDGCSSLFHLSVSTSDRVDLLRKLCCSFTMKHQKFCITLSLGFITLLSTDCSLVWCLHKVSLMWSKWDEGGEVLVGLGVSRVLLRWSIKTTCWAGASLIEHMSLGLHSTWSSSPPWILIHGLYHMKNAQCKKYFGTLSAVAFNLSALSLGFSLTKRTLV